MHWKFIQVSYLQSLEFTLRTDVFYDLKAVVNFKELKTISRFIQEAGLNWSQLVSFSWKKMPYIQVDPERLLKSAFSHDYNINTIHACLQNKKKISHLVQTKITINDMYSIKLIVWGKFTIKFSLMNKCWLIFSLSEYISQKNVLFFQFLLAIKLKLYARQHDFFSSRHLILLGQYFDVLLILNPLWFSLGRHIFL